jgi:hypothetical protein
MEAGERDDDRAASLADRVVAIAAFVAILVTGFFGAEAESPHVTTATTAQNTHR